MKTKKQFFRVLLGLFFITFAFTAKAQSEFEQGSLDWKPLHIKPTISFYIPYAEQNELAIPANINLDATYDLGKAADVRAGLHYGNFKGISAGITLHAKDAMKLKKGRYIVSESMSSVTFYKGSAQVQSIFGPAVDAKLGFFEDTGIYARLQGGFEWQTRARAYYKGYGFNKNGLQLMRVQAVAAFLNMEGSHKLGMGGVFGYNWDFAPWKRISMSFGGDLGGLYMFGVKDSDNQWHPLLEIKIGASVKI